MTLDHSILLWINQGWADPGLDFLFGWVSERATFSMPLLFGLLLIFWRFLGKDGIKLWLLMIFAVVMGDMLGNQLKQMISMPRPCYDLYELLRPPGGGEPRQCDAPTTGMPSNHALNFFLVASFLAYALPFRWLNIIMLFGLAILVGLSRIYLAKHYPSQVLTGAVIGIGFGWMLSWLGLRSFSFGQNILYGKASIQSKLSDSLIRPSLWNTLMSSHKQNLQLNHAMVWMPLLLAGLMMFLIWLGDWNQSLFFFFNQLSSITSPALWANLTLLGDTLVVFALLGLFVRHRPDIVGAAFIAALFATLWVHSLKPLLDIPRPLGLMGADMVNVIGHELRRNSFPSGHTTTAFTFAGVILLRGVQPILAMIILCLALLAGLSRAVVGAHWPLDILAGILGGWLSASLGVWLAQRWKFMPSHWLNLLMMLLFLGCGIALLITRQLGYPQAIGLQMLLGLICSGYVLWQILHIGQSSS